MGGVREKLPEDSLAALMVLARILQSRTSARSLFGPRPRLARKRLKKGLSRRKPLRRN